METTPSAEQTIADLKADLIATQKDLIAAQKQIIALQKRVDRMTPKTPNSKDVFWHIASKGIGSNEAATSRDLALLRRFLNWNTAFAEKYIKPYVNPKVYGECLNQMTRGLPERIADAQTNMEMMFTHPPKPDQPPHKPDQKVIAFR